MRGVTSKGFACYGKYNVLQTHKRGCTTCHDVLKCRAATGAAFIVQKAHNAIAGKKDDVNHPSHYTEHPSGVECIQITEHMNFCLGNAMKYIWRAGLKDGQSAAKDLKKARWYIDRELKRIGGDTDASEKRSEGSAAQPEES